MFIFLWKNDVFDFRCGHHLGSFRKFSITTAEPVPATGLGRGIIEHRVMFLPFICPSLPGWGRIWSDLVGSAPLGARASCPPPFAHQAADWNHGMS